METTLSFKVSFDEARLIRSLAKCAHLTLSEYLRRQATNRPVQPSLQPKYTRCRHTGAKIFAAMPESKPLTTHSVREMLADFP